MEQHTTEVGAPGPAYIAPRAPQALQAPPTMAVPQAGPPAVSAPEFPLKKKWWSMPKVLVAAGIAVVLAGGGGGYIGYSWGKSDAQHQFTQRSQNGRPNGANGQARRAPGQAQPAAPSTPAAGKP
ncbi:hypothetical protein GCM10009825_22140 [Arthrobacter humicola]|uniref:Uncharacterized protein n=1 Tax=Arthrobacter humicola TaxID=409291 RepID=A0ABP5KSB0_9MICC